MPRSRRIVASLAVTVCTLAGCTQVVRYSEALVNDPERTWLTKLPATIGGTVGFAVGVPVDVAAFLPAWLVYRSQPRETRDPLSVFLFPSFVLWKVGTLVGTPFDAVEWATWRGWQPAQALTAEEREAIEREWDTRLSFPEYPVTPLYPPVRVAPTSTSPPDSGS